MSHFRDIRKSRGLSLNEASTLADIHKSQLSRFERGEGGLSVDALYRLARALEVTDLANHLQPLVRERVS